MKKSKEPRVNERQRLVAIYFCGECIGNAERACIKAGYSEKYARGNAYKVVKSKAVQDYIAYITEQLKEKEIATIEEIQHYWTVVMNDEKELTKNRLRASELLAKSHGAFNKDDW